MYKIHNDCNFKNTLVLNETNDSCWSTKPLIPIIMIIIDY